MAWKAVTRALRAIVKTTLSILLVLGTIVGLHWMFADRLPPTLQHPLTAWRLVRSDPPSRLPVPVTGVQPSQLRDTWHATRSGGRLHQGIDIFAPRGRPVVSATPGIVLTVGENQLGGRIVRVLGPGGQWHYYAHLDAYGAIRPGQIVDAGTVLGFVGTSGNARGTSPHLHYGIYAFAGGAINPYPLLAGQ
jgi:murein DD-endopeptidase MepM/ murein hydrolase activator NlpD